MPSDSDLVRRYEELKDRADRARRRADQAKGAEAQVLTQLKDEYGCKTEQEAGKLLKRLEREEKEAAAGFATELEKWEKEYGALLAQNKEEV